MAQYTLDGSEKKIELVGYYASIKNNSAATIYVSQLAGIDPNGENVTPIQAGESVSIPANSDRCIYLLGSGKVAIISGNEWQNFFKSAPAQGGGGANGGVTQEQLEETLQLYATTASVQQGLFGKVDVVAGMGLSSNDYTTEEKEKLAGFENYDDFAIKQDIAVVNAKAESAQTIANNNADDIAELSENKADKTEIPTSLPANGGNADTVGGYAAEQLIQSNPNLLLNSNFRINQRNATSVNNGVGVDRWHGSYTVDDTGLLLDNSSWGALYQVFDRNWFKQFDGETLTLSISVDGVVYSDSSMMFTYNGQYDTNNFISTPFNVDIYSSSATSNPYLRIFGNTGGKHVEWVKLEVGNKATPYIPPNPTLELLNCMRYYQTSASLNGSMNSNCPITKAAMDGSKLSAVELAVPMRITPTINIFSAINGNSNTVNEWASDSPVSNIVTYYANEKTFVVGSTAINGFEIGKHYAFHYVASAEL